MRRWLRCSHERQHDGRLCAPAACILVGIGQSRRAQLAVMLLDLVTLPGCDPVAFVDEISAVSAPRVEISCGRIRCVDLRDSALLSRGRGPPLFRRRRRSVGLPWQPPHASGGCSVSVLRRGAATGAYRTSCGSSGKGRRANLSNMSRVVRRNGVVDLYEEWKVYRRLIASRAASSSSEKAVACAQINACR